MVFVGVWINRREEKTQVFFLLSQNLVSTSTSIFNNKPPSIPQIPPKSRCILNQTDELGPVKTHCWHIWFISLLYVVLSFSFSFSDSSSLDNAWPRSRLASKSFCSNALSQNESSKFGFCLPFNSSTVLNAFFSPFHFFAVYKHGNIVFLCCLDGDWVDAAEVTIRLRLHTNTIPQRLTQVISQLAG